MEQKIPVYVELLDEGTPTLRAAYAMPAEAGLYHLLAVEGYDPQDEDWDFKPGSLVRLAEEPLHSGGMGWVVKHPNQSAVRIYVESAEKNAPPLRNTYGIPTANDLYEVQATPHYKPSQMWKFPPGSIVRLKPMETSFPGWNPLVAVEP